MYGGFIGTERARVLFRRGMINKSENKCQVGGKKRLGEMKWKMQNERRHLLQQASFSILLLNTRSAV